MEEVANPYRTPEQAGKPPAPGLERGSGGCSRQVAGGVTRAMAVGRRGSGLSVLQANRSDAALRRSEHKRWQMGVVLKVSAKAFGSGRLMPITRR